MKQTNRQTTNEFSTRDLYLGAVLKLSGISIIRIEESNGRGIFVFEASKEIEAISRDYFNGTLRVDPQSLFAAWKALKSAAFSAINSTR